MACYKDVSLKMFKRKRREKKAAWTEKLFISPLTKGKSAVQAQSSTQIKKEQKKGVVKDAAPVASEENTHHGSNNKDPSPVHLH